MIKAILSFSSRTILTISLVLASVLMASAQCVPLMLPYGENNSQDGIMFDIEAISDVTVTGFSANLCDTGPYDMEIYTKTGTHIGFEANAAAWTLIGNAVGVATVGPDLETPIPIVINVPIPAGQVAAFYVTESANTGNNMCYTDGGSPPQPAPYIPVLQDANIIVYEGTGKDYAFGNSYYPRMPNFTIEYECCPAPLLVPVNESCGGAGNGSVEATGTGVGPWTYEILDATSTSIELTGPLAGPYTFENLIGGTYTVIATDMGAGGCAAQDIATINADLEIQIDLTITDNLCFGGELGMVEADISDGVEPYSIVFSDPFGNPIQANLPDSNIVDSLASITYGILVTDANGCTGQAPIPINQPPTPLTIILGATDALCAGAADGIVSAQSDGVGPYTYIIDDVNGNNVDTILNNPAAPYDVNGLVAGTYFVEIIDANGCPVNDIIEVNQPFPLFVESSANEILCYNQPTGEANIDLISGGTPPYDPVSWDDPAAQTGSMAVDLLPGTYTATIVDANGCELEQLVVFDNPPQMNLVPRYYSDTCNAGKGTAVIVPSLGTPPYTYLWKLDSLDTPAHPDLYQGFYEVVVTDGNGCKDSTLVEVKDSITYPVAEFVYRFTPDEDQLNQQIQFEDKSSDAVQWQWYFGNGDLSNLQHPVHNYRIAGDYLVQLIVSNGFCPDTAWDYVNIDPLLTVYVPNAFTPGRNGKNDVFGPRGEGIEKESWDMFIYDRWGKLVWQTGNYDQFWDGTNMYSGNIVNAGTYVYYIEFREFADLDRHEYTGWVHVIKD